VDQAAEPSLLAVPRQFLAQSGALGAKIVALVCERLNLPFKVSDDLFVRHGLLLMS
jgi:hypothetical protein